jgi:D-sedoheptulose 7-phosphate isomerase
MVNLTLQSVDEASVDELISLIVRVFKSGKKVLICGNGGSASTAEHFAVDLGIGSLVRNKGVKVIALTANSAIVTAIGNDLNFESIFSKQVELLGEKDDL